MFPGTYGAVTPTFAVVDPDAEVIARYTDGTDIAIAAKRVGEGLSVYSGVLQMPSGMLRALAQRAGVHVYSEQDDVVMAGSDWVGLHATTAGAKTVRLPSAATCRDAVSGEMLGPAEIFSFTLQAGDTKLLRVESHPGLK